MRKSIYLSTFLLLNAFSFCAWSYVVDQGEIYDSGNHRVQLRGVNWFGFETQNYIVHGLWTRNWKDMIRQMKSLGFNAVRLPFCPTTLRGVAPNSINYSKNADLIGLDSLQILDAVMAEMDRQEMYVLLDHHRPDCNAVSELWYTSGYSEQQWIDDLVFVAARYRNLRYFLGLDLKNEPHGKASWGTGNLDIDWNVAAETAADAVLTAAPDLLVFVEGIQGSPVCSGSINHWWGGNLEPQICFPLDIAADKLVLSPHVYGPDVYRQPYFGAANFPTNMPAIWDAHFGQFHDAGYAVVIGEFGGRYGHGGDSRDRIWQDALIDYLIANGMDSSFYWSWNPNSGDTGGILQDDWQNVWQDKVDLLQTLWGEVIVDPPAAPTCPDSADNDADRLIDFPADAGCTLQDDDNESDSLPSIFACSDGVDNDGDGLVDFPADSGCNSDQDDDEFNLRVGGDISVTTRINSDWAAGYCMDATVTNNSLTTMDWFVELKVEGRINQVWNAVNTAINTEVRFDGLVWNNLLQPGTSTDFGFCADRESVPVTACDDGIDNDGDGLIDFPEDPGCENSADGDEFNLPPPENNLITTVTTTSQWNSGYCADVNVSNTTGTAVDWTVTLSISGVVYNLWNADYFQKENTITAKGLSWNNLVQPDGTVTFGFCANQ